jgi:hypothetical protein
MREQLTSIRRKHRNRSNLEPILIFAITKIFFDKKGIVNKEFDLGGQTATCAYYCDILWQLRENSPQTLSTRELAVASRQRTVTHFLFRYGICDQKQYGCHPPPTLHFFVSLIEDKTERPPFLHN